MRRGLLGFFVGWFVCLFFLSVCKMTLNIIKTHEDTKEKQPSKGADWKGQNSSKCAVISMVPFTEMPGHLIRIHVLK